MTPQATLFLKMLHDGARGEGPRAPDGTPQGRWTFTAASARRADGLLVDGAPHGTWRVWDAQGQLRSESQWDHGVPSGRWVTWGADGTLERVDMKGDERPVDGGVLVVLAQRLAGETLPV
jgi:hypothetical protein